MGTWDGDDSTVDELTAAVEVLWVLMAGRLAGGEGGNPMLELAEVKVVCIAGADTKEELPMANVDVF